MALASATTADGQARRARLRALTFLASRLAMVLGWAATPALAQFEPDCDEVVIEDEEAPVSSGAAVPAAGRQLSAEDARAWAHAGSLYIEPPDLANCRPGKLQPAAKASFVAALNALRARHGLAAVEYDTAADQAAAEAALIMAANNTLSHDPPPNWTCWTASGAAAAGSSNLLGGVSSPYLAYEDDNAILAEWLIEGDGDEIGHRRWLLDPYLAQTTLGRVLTILPGGVRVDSVVMKVFDFSGQPTRRAHGPSIPPFVAWPQGEYPATFFSPRARMSFSVSQPPDDADEMAQVDFSQATVAISDGATNLPIHDQRADNEGFGVANCLSWRVDGIVAGRTYYVTISGVRGAPRARYEYNFRILN